jgi:dCTP deaminase
MILTDRQIRDAIALGDVIVTPFDDVQVQSASIDLRVGEEGATTKTKKRINIREHGFLILEPGDFGVISIFEELQLGAQYVGRIGLRSKYARKGLIATTGPQIDPGYHGRLTLGVTNLTPQTVSIPYKDDILTLELHRLDQPAENPYSGPYQDKLGLGPEDLEVIAEGDGMAFSEVLTTLRTLSANVGHLTSKMDTMQWVIPTILAVGIGVITIVVSIFGVIMSLKH